MKQMWQGYDPAQLVSSDELYATWGITRQTLWRYRNQGLAPKIRYKWKFYAIADVNRIAASHGFPLITRTGGDTSPVDHRGEMSQTGDDNNTVA